MPLIHPWVATLFTFIMALLAVFFLFLFLMRSDHKMVNRFLAITLVICIIDCWYYAFYFSNPEFALQHPNFYGFQAIGLYLIFPGFYLYFRKILEINTNDKLAIWPHYTVFFLILIALHPILFLSAEKKLTLLTLIFSLKQPSFSELGIPHYSQFFISISHFLYLFLVGFYTYKTHMAYRSHTAQFEQIFSNLDKIKTRWVKSCIGFFVVYGMIIILSSALIFIIEHRFSLLSLNLFVLANGGLYTFVALQGILHPYIYSQRLKEALHDRLQTAPKPKYHHSKLSRQEAKSIRNRLLTHLEKNKPFLNESLTIKELSAQLNIKRSQTLSEVINQDIGECFYDLINCYRAKEAKSYIEQSAKFSTMAELAFAVGFNSVATFNRQFKKLTGFSPKQYQKKVLPKR